MSINSIRTALESGIAGMSPTIATVWENTEYTPVTGTPYQRLYLLSADPGNNEFGPIHLEQGIFQVSLFYPLGAGTAAAAARAELIRTTFKRFNTFSSGGVDVNIHKTPHIKQARRDEDRWMLPIDISYFAHLTS